MLATIISILLATGTQTAPRQPMLAPRTEVYNLATAKTNKRRK